MRKISIVTKEEKFQMLEKFLELEVAVLINEFILQVDDMLWLCGGGKSGKMKNKKVSKFQRNFYLQF